MQQPARPGFNPNFHPLWSLNWALSREGGTGDLDGKSKRNPSILDTENSVSICITRHALFFDCIMQLPGIWSTMNCAQSFTKTCQSDKGFESSSDLCKTKDTIICEARPQLSTYWCHNSVEQLIRKYLKRGWLQRAT